MLAWIRSRGPQFGHGGRVKKSRRKEQAYYTAYLWMWHSMFILLFGVELKPQLFSREGPTTPKPLLTLRPGNHHVFLKTAAR